MNLLQNSLNRSKKIGANAVLLAIDGDGRRVIPDEYWQKISDRLRWTCKLYKKNFSPTNIKEDVV